MFWPTSGIGHGPGTGYTAANWRTLLDAAFSGDSADEGVFWYWLKLSVAAGSGKVIVSEGAALIRGTFFQNDSPFDVTIPVSTGGTTAHRLVLRITYATQIVAPYLISAANGVAVVPSKVQNDGVIWDIDLAFVYRDAAGVITVQDAREYLHFNTRILGTMIDDGTVTGQQVAGSIAGAGLYHTGTDLNVAVDATTLEIASDTLRVKDNGIDDTKVGNRVPQFYRRQGGDPTDWAEAGTTSYTPGAVRMQGGIVNLTLPNGGSYGETTVTFPVAFSSSPFTVASLTFAGMPSGVKSLTLDIFGVDPNGPSQVHFRVYPDVPTGADYALAVNWFAVGPE